jgi:flagellar biosynthesis GTPase FlhF
MINVRSEGLKLDLVLLQNRVSGLTIDYQSISKSGELHKWIRIIGGMLSASVSSLEGSIPQILGEAARLPASQPLPPNGPEEGLQETAEPTMINVRSEGLKLDLVLLQNRVSGLTIDYQSISKSDELQRWLKIIDGMLSGSAQSPEGSNARTPSEPAMLPASQQQPPKEERDDAHSEEHEGSQKEEEEQERPQSENEEQEEPQKENEEQEEPPEEHGYRKVVLHAVDISLDTLGHDGKQAIFSLLENRYGFRENDIPDYPRSFVELLDELLGTSSQNLEREIISTIRKVWAAPGENLEAVVESLKEHYQTTAPVEVAAKEPRSIAAEANAAGFRYNATYSRRRD